MTDEVTLETLLPSLANYCETSERLTAALMEAISTAKPEVAEAVQDYLERGAGLVLLVGPGGLELALFGESGPLLRNPIFAYSPGTNKASLH